MSTRQDQPRSSRTRPYPPNTTTLDSSKAFHLYPTPPPTWVHRLLCVARQRVPGGGVSSQGGGVCSQGGVEQSVGGLSSQVRVSRLAEGEQPPPGAG